MDKRVKEEACSEEEAEGNEPEAARSNSLWSDLQFNLDVQIPSYLVNLLTLMGFDNALSLKLMTSEDVEHVEEMVQSGIRDLVDEERLGDYVGVYRKHPEKFRILPGHRKILDSMIHLLNQLESYGGSEPPTSSSSSAPSAWNNGWANDPDVEIVVEPETTQGVLPVVSEKRKLSVECEEGGVRRGGRSVVKSKRKCGGAEAYLEEPGELQELRGLLYDILKRWIDQSKSFFEMSYTMSCVTINLDKPRVLSNGAMGEPTAVVTCLLCRSTVRIQCLPCRYKPGLSRRWVISNFQRHVKRAHFKPEFRPLPDVSTTHHYTPTSPPHTITFAGI